MRVLPCLLALALLAAAAPPLDAQRMRGRDARDGHAREAVREGRRMLTFGWPFSGGGGSGTFQYARMRSERTALGLQLDVNLSHSRQDRAAPSGPDDSDTRASVHVGPVLKRYLDVQAVVAPYLRGAATVGAHYMRQERETSGAPTAELTRWQPSVTLSGGLGLDWFPLARLAVGGHTGLRAHASMLRSDEMDSTGLSLATFTSSLEVTFFF